MPTSINDLDGLFKQVYADSIKNLIPETAKLYRMIPFSQEDRIGKQYNQPVILTYEHGVTYAAPASGAFALGGAISMKTQEAQVDGFQMVIQGQMDYETAAKASSGNDVRAFKKATILQTENMMESAVKRLELDFLYGQVGLGKTLSSSNVDATTTDITLTTASWGTGIWSGMENARIQFFKVSDGSLVSSGADSIFSISKVDVENRLLRVTGTATGITALDAAILAGTLDIYWYTSRTSATVWQQMVGIDKIITNTGVLFNIDASQYNLWKGNTYNVGGTALTLGKVLKGISSAIAKGLNEKVTVCVNDRTWSDITTDQAALRKYDARYNEGEGKNGFESIRFYSANGELEIMPYNCIKEGEAFAIPIKRMKRIGAQDLSFNALGNEGRFFRELDAAAGFEYRLFSDQSIFCETPAKTLKFTNIVNTP